MERKDRGEHRQAAGAIKEVLGHAARVGGQTLNSEEMYQIQVGC